MSFDPDNTNDAVDAIDAVSGPSFHGHLAGSLQALSCALEERDVGTDLHCDRVALLAHRLGLRCGLDATRQHRLALAARFHDIGKLGIPDRVLLSPRGLDQDEVGIMRSHSERGQRIFLATGRVDAVEVATLIRAHHEAFDGSGYPDGLRHQQIPLEARILAIVDGYDALASERPYRAPMAHDAVMQLLDDEQGSRIDPDVFREFATLMA